MIVIGLTGPIAAGKSVVARELERLGAAVIDADRLGHEVLESDQVIRAARDRWGPTVLDARGQIKRSEVARRVFADPPSGPAELAWFEQLTHPLIERRMRARLESLRADRRRAAAVLDAPLLRQVGWDRYCDVVVWVDAPEPICRERARRRGWTDAQFTARRRAQQRSGGRNLAPDVVIDNSGTLERTARQVREVWRRLTEGENSRFLQNGPSRTERKPDNE